MLPDVHAQDGGLVSDDGGLCVGALRDCTPPTHLRVAFWVCSSVI